MVEREEINMARKETKFNIREIAYELYKQNWVDTHTTREMRLDALREYCSYKIISG